MNVIKLNWCRWIRGYIRSIHAPNQKRQSFILPRARTYRPIQTNQPTRPDQQVVFPQKRCRRSANCQPLRADSVSCSAPPSRRRRMAPGLGEEAAEAACDAAARPVFPGPRAQSSRNRNRHGRRLQLVLVSSSLVHVERGVSARTACWLQAQHDRARSSVEPRLAAMDGPPPPRRRPGRREPAVPLCRVLTTTRPGRKWTTTTFWRVVLAEAVAIFFWDRC
jgi:hypothetical protein